MEWEEINKIVEEFKDKEKAKFSHIKKGDPLEYNGNKYRLESVWFDSKKGLATALIMIPSMSGESYYGGGKIKRAGYKTNVYDPEKLKPIKEIDFSNSIETLEDKINGTDSISKKERLERCISKIKNMCLHKVKRPSIFDDYRYCELCGKEYNPED